MQQRQYSFIFQFSVALLFISSLAINSQANANQQGIALLVRQCLSQPPISSTFTLLALDKQKGNRVNERLALAAVEFERQTLGFQNIYSLLQYYQAKKLKLPSSLQEAIVQCQLRLADQFEELTQNTEFKTFITELKRSNEVHLAQLGHHLYEQSWNPLSRVKKSQLHVAEANILSRLNSKALHLDKFPIQCQLQEAKEKSDAKSKQVKNRFDIRHYLTTQENSECRQQIWQAYQRRAKKFTTPPMELIVNIRQAQAREVGFSDYAHYQLRNNFLNTPHKVKQFLDSQTKALNFAPWDINRKLSMRDKPNTKSKTPPLPLDIKRLTKLTLLPFNKLGLILEPVSPNSLHLWHENRFLGEIIVTTSNAFYSSSIRKSVIGHQFGQSELSIKNEIRTNKDIKQLAKVLAKSIEHLVPGQHHYLNAALSLEPDMANIPTKWLSSFLAEQLLNLPALKGYQSRSQQLEIIADYQQQLKVFRSKIALNLFQAETVKSYPDITSEFEKSFNGKWPQASDMQYAFKSIVYQGTNFYNALWQDKLTLLITHQATIEPQVIFSQLIVNEKALPVSKRLEMVLNKKLVLSDLLLSIREIH